MLKTTTAVLRSQTKPDAKPALRKPIFITVDQVKPGSCAHSTLFLFRRFRASSRESPQFGFDSAISGLTIKYLHHPDTKLQDYSIQVMDILQLDTSINAQALVCLVLMTEETISACCY